MKINTKKITSLALATIIAIGSTSAYAANFKDVTKGHWAESYIDKGNELGLLQGYEDGSFKPEKSIARIEAISLAGRAMNLKQSEIDEAIKQHKAIILKHGFDAWTVPDLSIALSQGIIDENVLTKLKHDNGSFTLSPREEAVIFMAKAMGLQEEAEALDSNLVLPFKDNDKINKAAKPYVYLLNKHKIIVGDDNGFFNPKHAINRASMSVVVSSAYDYIEEQKKNDKDEVKPEKPEEGKEYIKGSISKIFTALGEDHVVIVTHDGKSLNYKLDEKSELKLDGKVILHADLLEGLEVKITIKEDKDSQNPTIKTLEAENKVEIIDGTIYDLEDATNKSITIEHQENSISKKRTINLNDKTRIFLDKKEAKFSDLRKQDRIKIHVINNVIDEIEAESYIREIEGVLKNVDTVDSKYIDIKTEDGTEVRYQLSKDADIVRNKKSSSLSELRRGDKVELTVADDIVTKVNAEIVKSYVEGKIKSKKISYNSGEITIINEENRKEETYVVPNNIVVKLDDTRVGLDKLELGYYVEINLEGEEVVEVNGLSTTLEDKHLGRITDVGIKCLEVTLNSGNRVEVNIDKALIKNQSGYEIGLSSLKKGDGILISGDIYGNEIVASEIMRFSK